MDTLLARLDRCASGCDFPAREVSKSSPFVPDPAFGMAFLDGVRRLGLGTDSICRCICVDAAEEALIGARISQNIKHSQRARRHEVVFEQRLLVISKARHVRSRVPPVLFKRSGVNHRVARSPVAIETDSPRRPCRSTGRLDLEFLGFHHGTDFRRPSRCVDRVGTRAWANGEGTSPHKRSYRGPSIGKTGSPGTKAPRQNRCGGPRLPPAHRAFQFFYQHRPTDGALHRNGERDECLLILLPLAQTKHRRRDCVMLDACFTR